MDDGTLVTVIPDAQSTTLITEVKDVVNLSNSDQFRAYFATNRRIDLIVSPNTKTISKPLEELIYRSKGSIHIFDPATKTFTPWNLR
jgi:filamentous hemagglutinin